MFLTPIACAATGGHHDVIALLLEMGADIDPIDRNTRTPLHLAAIGGHARVAKLLIDKKARLDARDNTGNNPLDIAIHFGKT